ncbi:TetR/AcrR family transcriptional regulator [Enterocloster clostridioformis]
MIRSTHTLAQKSQKWIVSALFNLMEKTPYKNITVTEICKTAQVDRRTFYRNFSSKDDIIDFYVQELKNDFINFLSSVSNPSIKSMIIAQFVFWKKHLDFLNLLDYNGMLAPLVYSVSNNFIPQIYSHYHANIPEHFEYKCAFVVGGFCNVLTMWISSGATETPDEIANYISSLFDENSAYWASYT